MSDLRKAEDLVTVVQAEREAALKVIQPDAPALLPCRQHYFLRVVLLQKSEADEAALQQQLHSAQEQIQMLTTERNKLAAELATK